ncbi:hypothetical protein KCG48_13585, partial [Proteiniclasticum sp. BAD-10]
LQTYLIIPYTTVYNKRNNKKTPDFLWDIRGFVADVLKKLSKSGLYHADCSPMVKYITKDSKSLVRSHLNLTPAAAKKASDCIFLPPFLSPGYSHEFLNRTP